MSRYTSIMAAPRDILPVQAMRLASDSSVSIAVNLVEDDHFRLGDTQIYACMLLQPWKRFLDEIYRSSDINIYLVCQR